MKNSAKGFLIITIMAIAAWFMAMIPAVKELSLSPLIMGILLGMVYANTLRSRQPKEWDGGLKFCSKRMLRTGIILYGFRLTFQDVIAVGTAAFITDCIVVGATLGIGIWVGRRLGIDRETTLMTSTGSAICGAAAVLGAEPIVKGKSHQTAIAVSTVVIFGTISMFLYPIIYRTLLSNPESALYLDPKQMGVYTGSTLHEVAHVVGAGNAMGSDIATNSLIVKMVRVILLVPVLLIMSWALSRGKSSEGGTKINVPWFAFMFLAMIGVNSLLHGTIAEEAFDKEGGFMWPVMHTIEVVSTFMLTLAMTALGSDTSIDKFRQAGAKPFVLAGIIYTWLISGGYLLAKFLVPLF